MCTLNLTFRLGHSIQLHSIQLHYHHSLSNTTDGTMKAAPLLVSWHNDNNPIYSAHFEPHGKGRLATAGGDNNVRVSQVQSTLIMATQSLAMPVRASCRYFYIDALDESSLTHSRQLWKIDGSGEDRSVTYLSTLAKHTQAVNVVRWCPRGSLQSSTLSADGLTIGQVNCSHRPETMETSSSGCPAGTHTYTLQPSEKMV